MQGFQSRRLSPGALATQHQSNSSRTMWAFSVATANSAKSRPSHLKSRLQIGQVVLSMCGGPFVFLELPRGTKMAEISKAARVCRVSIVARKQTCSRAFERIFIDSCQQPNQTAGCELLSHVQSERSGRAVQCERSVHCELCLSGKTASVKPYRVGPASARLLPAEPQWLLCSFAQLKITLEVTVKRSKQGFSPIS